MITKRKMSVTIDAEIFEAVEKAAQACNMGKNLNDIELALLRATL